MTRLSRMMWPLLLALVAGCGSTSSPVPSNPTNIQLIRVRLVQETDRVSLSCSGNPYFSLANSPDQRELVFSPGQSVAVTLSASGWQIGAAQIPPGVLTLRPPAGGSLAVNANWYRGEMRLVPVVTAGSGGRFDVVNDLSVEDYLKGVLARELYRDWHLETYKAQAIVARTYALYHARTEGVGRYWDVYPDTRSQVYGGLAAETDKSRTAVEETSGIVLTYGPGEGKIFEAFFSSCCGGVSQDASAVFPQAPAIPPLAARVNGDRCIASPYFSWPPVTIARGELTRRLQLWGSRQNPPRPVAGVVDVARVDIAGKNLFGRPTHFRITDSAGPVFILPAEDFRAAINTDAQAGTTVPSSFFQINNGASTVKFFNGHGLGHGVGMCQWCAEAQAAQGQSCEDILSTAYPQAKLVRAY